MNSLARDVDSKTTLQQEIVSLQFKHYEDMRYLLYSHRSKQPVR